MKTNNHAADQRQPAGEFKTEPVLRILQQSLDPSEMGRFLEFRAMYSRYRQGAAHGAKGRAEDVRNETVDTDGGTASDQAACRGPAEVYPTTLEAEVVGLFQPPKKVVAAGTPEREVLLAWKLGTAEREFLNTEHITTKNVTLEDISARFTRSDVPESMGSVDEYIDAFVESVVKDSVHCNAPKMIGHMTMSLPFFMRPLAKLVTAMHQNNVKTETGKTTTFMEREALAMLHRQLFRLDDAFYAEHGQNAGSALGLVCSGGTLANISAMWIARNSLLRPKGDGSGEGIENFAGVEKVGLLAAMRHYGFDDAVVIGTKLLHYSMKKATDVLGLGTAGLRLVPFGDDYRVDLAAMEEEILRCRASNTAIVSLVGVAGATETGSIDDLAGIAALAAKYKLHFHVDAAWGGPCIFSETQSKKMMGIELADTVTLDGHKQLYTPMGVGLCFLRDPTNIRFVQKTANYIIRKESHDTGKFTIEGSRPASAVFMHANLHILGIKGYGALIDRSCRLVRKFADKVFASNTAELVVDPATNIFLYRYIPSKYVEACRARDLPEEAQVEIDAFNVKLQTEQKARGDTFVSRTTIWSPRYNRGVVALRVVIANPLTTERDIDLNVDAQLSIYHEMEASE